MATQEQGESHDGQDGHDDDEELWNLFLAFINRLENEACANFMGGRSVVSRDCIAGTYDNRPIRGLAEKSFNT